MSCLNTRLPVLALISVLIVACGPSEPERQAPAGAKSQAYEDLVSLVEEAREALRTQMVEGVPDYTAPSMNARQKRVHDFRERLRSIDPNGWPVSQRVDYLLVRAQLDGLDFEHRVLKPWSRDPGIYLTDAAISVFSRANTPVVLDTPERVAEFRRRLKALPHLFEQARRNLTEPAVELARIALRAREREFEFVYQDLVARVKRNHADLISDLEVGRAAIDDFKRWITENVNTMTSHAGIGQENYDWYLKHVALMPYTMDQIRTIGEREMSRSMAFLKIEHHKNRGLPVLAEARDEAEHRLRVQEADAHILQFVREQEILTVPETYALAEPEPLWVARPNPNERANGDRNFFQKGETRDARPLQLHITVPGHHFDGVMAASDERPIRGVSLFRIGNIRGEGWAFYLEEMMPQAGLLDARPRTKEIAYLYQTMRAARTPAELRMHTNEFTYDAALKYMASRAPYWLHDDDPDLVDELGGYLRRPTAGIAYLMGKVQIEELLADRGRQQGDSFDLRQFHDEFLAAGRIPIALIRWEMTGLDDQIKRLW